MTQPEPAQSEFAQAASTLPAPLAALAKSVWWIVLLRGILAIIFGVLAVISPAAALTHYWSIDRKLRPLEDDISKAVWRYEEEIDAQIH